MWMLRLSEGAINNKLEAEKNASGFFSINRQNYKNTCKTLNELKKRKNILNTLKNQMAVFLLKHIMKKISQA